MKGKYVYCIIPAQGKKTSFGGIGFDSGEVYTLGDKYFKAVVSDSPMKEYEAREEDVEVHRKVAEKVLEEYSIIPVAYGMVFKNRKLLLPTMRKARKAMRKAMKVVDGRIELGVKAVLPKGEDGREELVEQCSRDFATLKSLAVDFKKLKLFSSRLLLNSSYLVERGMVGDFSRAVGRLEEGYAPLKIQYTGPWPPYNFVDIHILGKGKGGFR